jgi:hypothetical protein
MRAPCILHFITLYSIFEYNMTQKGTTDLACQALHAATSNHRRTSKISSLTAGKWGCLMTGYSSLGHQSIGVKVEQTPCRAVWTQFEKVLAILCVNSYLSPTALSANTATYHSIHHTYRRIATHAITINLTWCFIIRQRKRHRRFALHSIFDEGRQPR